MPLPSSLLVIIKGFINENAYNGTCLIWGRYRFGIRVWLILFDGIWSMEGRDWRVRRLVSEGY